VGWPRDPRGRPGSQCRTQTRRAQLGGSRRIPPRLAHGLSNAAPRSPGGRSAEVIATSRSAAKRDTALEIGAVAAIDSTTERWDVRADIVVESVGPATWNQSMRALKPGGRLVVCGGTSGTKAELNLPALFFKQYEVIGSSMGSYQEFAEVTRLMAGGLAVHVDKVLGLADYPAALQRLDAGEQLGKIVLRH
jgi:NADPH:quinone reductase-like Zn-dependent oxidoreductase